MSLMIPRQIKSVSIRLTTPEDMHLPAYDNTRLQAVNTCPTWGQLRYGMHKAMSHGGRAMALEMGTAAHEVFAAVRLWQLRTTQQLPDLADFHGPRLFGATRYDAMLSAVDGRESENHQAIEFCLSALETSGFYDDPSDKRRTFTNLEEACLAYINKWDWNRMPVWVRDASDPQSDVGIELPFDVTLSFVLVSGHEVDYRFIGKADGLHVRDGKLVLHENKTASRLDEAWRQSFSLSSQVTGYMLSLGVWAQAPITLGEVYGMTVPLPKSYDFGGLVREPVSRSTHHFERWFDWFLHTVELDQMYKDNPFDAPKYTHSCNRYFRPCSMIPFCDSDKEQQVDILADMVDDEWSPLHEVTAGD